MADKVKLGSVGLGWWGGVLADAAAETGEAEIVSCFARREPGRQAFADKHSCRQAPSYAELVEDPEVQGVLIATSHHSHRALIEQAAAAGKAVFVEKPLTITVDDGRAAIDAANEAGVILQVGHQRRRSAANRRIKEMVEAGELGDIESLNAVQSVPGGHHMPEEAWRLDESQSPLGGMTSLGIHKLDSMRYLAGPIRSVFCFTRPGRQVPIDETTVLALEFDSGALGTLTTSFFTPTVSELSVYGTDRTAYMHGDGTQLDIQKRGEMSRDAIELTPVNPVVDQLAEFARAIRGETQVEVDGPVGLDIVAILEAAVESASTGRSVDVGKTS